MFLVKNLIIFSKYFLKAKWTIKLPKKNKFILVDGIYNPFLKYIKKKDFTILYRREEEINFSILLKCLLKFKFTTLDYCVEFIKHVSPKLILTAYDYHTIFYKLSRKTGIKTLMLQKGKRSKEESLTKFSKFYFPKDSKKENYVDYMLFYNKTVTNFYSKRIAGNSFEIGSFENNFKKLDLKKQKKEIIFISNYSADTNKCENENIVAFYLHKLAKKNNIKFNILPRFRTRPHMLEREKIYYNKFLKNNFKFIVNKKISSYDLLINYKYIFATYSTLAIECLAKGLRVGFTMFKSKKNPVFNYKFGDYENLPNKGLFWCASNKLDIREINRVFNFVTKTKRNTWIKKTDYYAKKNMNFDYKNKIFREIIKKYQ